MSLRRPGLAAAGLVVALVGLGLYGTRTLWGNRDSQSCAASAPTLAALAPLSRGELAAFEVAKRPGRALDLTFERPDGTPTRLGDLRGRTLLVNLWATWCEPCRREMPALDKLQGMLGGPGFEVVAINIDTRNLDKPKSWLKEVGVSHLAYYADPKANIFRELQQAGEADGMPTTLLIDPRGCQLGRMAGPADWVGPDGLALVRAALRS